MTSIKITTANIAAVGIISLRSTSGRACHALAVLESIDVSAWDTVRTITRIGRVEFIGIREMSLADPELDGAGGDLECVCGSAHGQIIFWIHVRIIRIVLERVKGNKKPVRSKPLTAL